MLTVREKLRWQKRMTLLVYRSLVVLTTALTWQTRLSRNLLGSDDCRLRANSRLQVKPMLARRRLCGAKKKDKISFYLEYVVYLHIQPLHQGDVHGRFV